jgi:hypothetical protein
MDGSELNSVGASLHNLPKQTFVSQQWGKRTNLYPPRIEPSDLSAMTILSNLNVIEISRDGAAAMAAGRH